MRHIASAGRDYDKKSGFANPDGRGGAKRTASHPYITDHGMRPVSDESEITLSVKDRLADRDMRGRWWPAPDMRQ